MKIINNLVASIFLCLVLFSPFSFAEEVDCNASAAEVDDQYGIRKYLKKYQEFCYSEEKNNRLIKYKLLPYEGLNEAWLIHARSAWRDLAGRFAALANDAPAASELRTQLGSLAKRATATGNELAQALISGSDLPDISLNSAGAWKANQDIALRAIRDFSSLNFGETLKNACETAVNCDKVLGQGRVLVGELSIAQFIVEKFSGEAINSVSEKVAAKNRLWDQYLYDSKPMLPFDFFLTDLANRKFQESDQYPDGFRPPPDTQWFLMHPAAALEYVGDAPEGEQFKPALYVEVIGVNRWREEARWFDLPLLKYFSGVSLVVSYADRAGVSDMGVGGLFVFGNVYSLGVVSYDGDGGVFLSLDLANLWREKYKPRYESLKEKL